MASFWFFCAVARPHLYFTRRGFSLHSLSFSVPPAQPVVCFFNKTPRTEGCGAKLCSRSNCTGNFARTQAAGADVDITGRTVYHGLHSFYIGFPCPVCTSMRVGDLDAKADALPAAITFRHFPAPPLSVCKSKENAQSAIKTSSAFQVAIIV